MLDETKYMDSYVRKETRIVEVKYNVYKREVLEWMLSNLGPTHPYNMKQSTIERFLKAVEGDCSRRNIEPLIEKNYNLLGELKLDSDNEWYNAKDDIYHNIRVYLSQLFQDDFNYYYTTVNDIEYELQEIEPVRKERIEATIAKQYNCVAYVSKDLEEQPAKLKNVKQLWLLGANDVKYYISNYWIDEEDDIIRYHPIRKEKDAVNMFDVEPPFPESWTYV